ncbi:MAG: hypothetical protein AVDCRST_MAG26-3131, partial [uncultured Chloroflexia bacterium]
APFDMHPMADRRPPGRLSACLVAGDPGRLLHEGNVTNAVV